MHASLAINLKKKVIVRVSQKTDPSSKSKSTTKRVKIDKSVHSLVHF